MPHQYSDIHKQLLESVTLFGALCPLHLVSLSFNASNDPEKKSAVSLEKTEKFGIVFECFHRRKEKV